MHYDAEILDPTIFDKIIDQHLLHKNSASSTACSITDLLVLFDTEKIKSIGGWDENLKNSYMEIDIRQRIYESGYCQPIIHNIDNPSEINHTDASILRNPEDSDNNLTYVYQTTFKEDYDYFFNKWGPKGIFEKPHYESVKLEQLKTL
jgi:hypothetical protein